MRNKSQFTNKAMRATRHAAYEAALNKAYDAARAAQRGAVEDPNALDCGFAWVVVYDISFMAWCRKKKAEMDTVVKQVPSGFSNAAILTGCDRYYGTKSTETGRTFWKPGGFPGQAISIHEAGARAFRDTLTHALQIRVEMGSRLD